MNDPSRITINPAFVGNPEGTRFDPLGQLSILQKLELFYVARRSRDEAEQSFEAIATQVGHALQASGYSLREAADALSMTKSSLARQLKKSSADPSFFLHQASPVQSAELDTPEDFYRLAAGVLVEALLEHFSPRQASAYLNSGIEGLEEALSHARSDSTKLARQIEMLNAAPHTGDGIMAVARERLRAAKENPQ